MVMRGNNRHFTRLVIPHELIPGHHLQQYYEARGPQRPFSTPFYVEGWALYWEMRLWDLGWAQTPEDRIGMLFWRMTRAARVTLTLKYHLGRMTPEEMATFLDRPRGAREARRPRRGAAFHPGRAAVPGRLFDRRAADPRPARRDGRSRQAQRAAVPRRRAEAGLHAHRVAARRAAGDSAGERRQAGVAVGEVNIRQVHLDNGAYVSSDLFQKRGSCWFLPSGDSPRARRLAVNSPTSRTRSAIGTGEVSAPGRDMTTRYSRSTCRRH